MALDQSNATLQKVLGLKDRLKDVEVKFTENEKKVEGATREADEAEQLADEAEQVRYGFFFSKF